MSLSRRSLGLFRRWNDLTATGGGSLYLLCDGQGAPPRKGLPQRSPTRVPPGHCESIVSYQIRNDLATSLVCKRHSRHVWAMPVYFFRVCNGTGYVPEEEGVALADDGAARALALKSARELMGEDIGRGYWTSAALSRLRARGATCARSSSRTRRGEGPVSLSLAARPPSSVTTARSAMPRWSADRPTRPRRHVPAGAN